MNTPHGIGVTNRFELFLDDDLDPLEILQRQEEEKQKRKLEKTQVKEKKPSKTGKPVAPAKKAPETAPPKVTKQDEVPNKPRGKPNDRPPRNFPENREAEKNNRNRDDQFFNPDNQRDGETRRGRGGYRGRGGARGDRGGRGGFYNNTENRPRRVFDRHSGSDRTGVRSTDKREGSGPGNWGDIRSDIKTGRTDTWEDVEQEKPLETSTWGEEENVAPKVEESSPKSDDANEEGKENDQTTEEQVQDAVKEMTLDEYKKEQQAKRMVPKYNIRKPGEGEDDKQWKKGYVLKKKTKDEEDDQEDDDEDDEEYGRRGPQKVLLNIEYNFSDSRRGTRGRGRGGRGGPRGGGRDMPNRDAPREDRFKDRPRGPPKSKQAAPRVDDFNDFPSLAN